MKLYYAPGACSLSPHIVLSELGLDYELEKVSTKTHLTETGRDFYEINPKGYVPALLLDDGEVLTEGPAIVQYIADQYPQSGLTPPPATLARARLQEQLTYIGTELHKSFSPLFSPATPEDARTAAKDKIAKRFAYLEAQFEDGRAYLLGDTFTVADAYLFAISNWAAPMGIDMTPWPWIVAWRARVAARPAVQSVLRVEGLA